MKILSKYDFTNKELPFEIPKKVWEVCFINKGCILNEVRQKEVDCFILFDKDTIYPACTNMGGFEYVANVFDCFDTIEEAQQRLKERENGEQ